MLAWDVISNHILFLFKTINTLGYIPLCCKIEKTVMLENPGKCDYTHTGPYRPISLLNTIGKVYEKTLTKYLSQTAERSNILHPGHQGARQSRSIQDYLSHIVTWIKANWTAGQIFGAILANLKSGFT